MIMLVVMRGSVLFAFILVASCGGATVDQLHTTSASSLECHESRMRYEQVSSEVWFVTGCGREATFVERCEATMPRQDCRWELSTGVRPAGTKANERALAAERKSGDAPDP